MAAQTRTQSASSPFGTVHSPTPPNDPAQQRRGLLELRTFKSLPAPAVCCSAWFGVKVPTDGGQGGGPFAHRLTLLRRDDARQESLELAVDGEPLLDEALLALPVDDPGKPWVVPQKGHPLRGNQR